MIIAAIPEIELIIRRPRADSPWNVVRSKNTPSIKAIPRLEARTAKNCLIDAWRAIT